LITYHLIHFLKSNDDVPEFSRKVKQMFRLPSYPNKRLSNNSMQLDFSLNNNPNSVSNNFSPNDKSLTASKLDRKKDKNKGGYADEEALDEHLVRVEAEEYIKKEDRIVNFYFCFVIFVFK
jgi:hypothetical protein